MNNEQELKELVQRVVRSYELNDKDVQVTNPLSDRTKVAVDRLVAFIKINY